MKFFIVLALVASVAVALPTDPKDAVIIKQNLDNIGVGDFSYGYETSNGISAGQSGALKNVGTENEALLVTGSFVYPGPDGVTYSVTYTADENGFRAQGAHLPVSPQ